MPAKSGRFDLCVIGCVYTATQPMDDAVHTLQDIAGLRSDWPRIHIEGLGAKAAADAHVAFVRTADIIRANRPYQWVLISDGLSAWIIPIPIESGSRSGTPADAADARALITGICDFIIGYSVAQRGNSDEAIVANGLTLGGLPASVANSARAVISAISRGGAGKWQLHESHRAVSGLFGDKVQAPRKKERTSQGDKQLRGTIEAVDALKGRITVHLDDDKPASITVNGPGAKDALRNIFRTRKISILASEYLQGDDRDYEVDIKVLRIALDQPEERV